MRTRSIIGISVLSGCLAVIAKPGDLSAIMSGRDPCVKPIPNVSLATISADPPLTVICNAPIPEVGMYLEDTFLGKDLQQVMIASVNFDLIFIRTLQDRNIDAAAIEAVVVTQPIQTGDFRKGGPMTSQTSSFEVVIWQTTPNRRALLSGDVRLGEI